jgi:hypothetical protein
MRIIDARPDIVVDVEHWVPHVDRVPAVRLSGSPAEIEEVA